MNADLGEALMCAQRTYGIISCVCLIGGLSFSGDLSTEQNLQGPQEILGFFPKVQGAVSENVESAAEGGLE